MLLVDDHVAIAQALAATFRSAGFGPVAVVAPDDLDVAGVLAAARRDTPDVALVDLNLGAERSGLSMIGPLVGAQVKVVAFTAREDELARAYCLEAGASGFLNKAEPFDVIVEYLRRVAGGERVVSERERIELVTLARTTRAAGDHRLASFQTLTRREREVLGALLRGLSAKEIAIEQGVAVKTVRSQIESIRTKLGVRSQLAAVALALEVGWLPH